MKFHRIVWLICAALSFLVLLGCSKASEEYKNGVYWLEKENNWQMAARAFRRGLNHNPRSWKTHVKLLEALSLSEDPDTFAAQLKHTIAQFPKKARSPELATSAIAIIGTERFDQITSQYLLQEIGDELAKNSNDQVLLSRGIMAACRARDSLVATDYYQRLLEALPDGQAPDTVIQELNFFIGPSHVEMIRQDWWILNHPDDVEARIDRLEAGLIVGNTSRLEQNLRETVKAVSDDTKLMDLARRFGQLTGFDPFNSKTLLRGRDGSYSPDGKILVFVKNMGFPRDPDYYIYTAPASGGTETPILKATQQFLLKLAWPKFSPDQSWIYFYGSDDKSWDIGKFGRFQLYRVRPRYGKQPERLTSYEMLPVEPYFEKSGSILVVRRDVGSARASVEIIRVHPGKDDAAVVSRIGEPMVCGAFTPKGDSLLFVTDRGIFRRAIDGGNISVDLNWIGFRFMQLSPDGRNLILVNQAGQHILVERKNPRPTYLGPASALPCYLGNDGTVLITRQGRDWNSIVRLNTTGKITSLNSFTSTVQ